jgi:hypothetical protein
MKSRTFACSIAFHFDPPLSILLMALLVAAPMARQQAGYMRMCGTDPFPMTSECKQVRDPGVACTRRVRKRCVQSAGGISRKAVSAHGAMRD